MTLVSAQLINSCDPIPVSSAGPDGDGLGQEEGAETTTVVFVGREGEKRRRGQGEKTMDGRYIDWEIRISSVKSTVKIPNCFQDEDKPRKPREAEFDRPMTKAQKAEYLRETEARERAEMRRQGKEIPPELQQSQSQSKSKVPSKGAAASSATSRQSGTNQ